MKFIFSDKDRYFVDQYQEAWLSEKTGWWTEKGEIYVWTPGQSHLQQIGIAVHEAFEWFIICKVITLLRRHRALFGLLANFAHWAANILEFAVTCGMAEQSWSIRDWYGGKDQGSARKNSKRREDIGITIESKLLPNGSIHVTCISTVDAETFKKHLKKSRIILGHFGEG